MQKLIDSFISHYENCQTIGNDWQKIVLYHKTFPVTGHTVLHHLSPAFWLTGFKSLNLAVVKCSSFLYKLNTKWNFKLFINSCSQTCFNFRQHKNFRDSKCVEFEPRKFWQFYSIRQWVGQILAHFAATVLFQKLF